MNPSRFKHFRSRRGPLRLKSLQRVAPGARSWPACVIVFVTACLLAVAAPQAAIAQCEREWAKGSGVPGVNGAVYATTVFNGGGGDALYVAGYFSVAGDTIVSNIAKWDGTTWSAVGSGLGGDDPSISALTVFDDGNGPALYAGGNFTTAGGVSANNIAKWDGKNWSPLGSGIEIRVRAYENYGVSALAVFDDGSGPALYAGGSLSTAGGLYVNSIAKWNGESWSALGDPIDSGDLVEVIYALTVFDDGGGPALYAGGVYHRILDRGYSYGPIFKRWDGESWSGGGVGQSYYGELWGGDPDFVSALTVFDDGNGTALYVGGAFGRAGSEEAINIAKWDGTNWSPLGTGLGGYFYGAYADPVRALAVFDDGSGPALFAAGKFTVAGGVSAKHIAKWDGKTWSAVGSGFGGSPRALTVFDDGGGPALYAGSVRWNGTTWSALGTGGFNSVVNAMTVFDDGGGLALYAGGYFTTVGGVSAKRIAKWNPGWPGTWSALGTGTNDSVHALTVFDDGSGPALYAGGPFTVAGDVGANGIAKWNPGLPGSWSAMGTGTNNDVRVLTVFDDGGGPALYAGGYIRTGGGSDVSKWDGSSWSGLGSGMGGNVFALAVFDDGSGPALYAGGNGNGIGKWDGTSWSSLGTGVNSAVRALAVFDDGRGPALYAGGGFTNAGGVVANKIAKWDGASWSAVGTGMNSAVEALAVFDDGEGPALYAGGHFFTTGGGMSAKHIAKWDGAGWSPLGSGMNSSVLALTDFDDGNGPALYAGGYFTTAGGEVSARFAKWACVQLDSCGNGVCEAALQEHCGNCVQDCRCESCERCHDGVCVDSCGDGFCDDSCGENAGTCPTDCGGCGDEECDPSTEDSCSCELDCGPPASENTSAACDNEVDDDCDGLTDCQDSDCTGITPCPGDCEVGSSECAVHSDCVDSTFCNGTESCDAGCCTAGTNPCEWPSACDESGRTCRVCPAQHLLGEDETAAEAVALIRRYRDEILASTPRGRWYIEEFYANGIEVTRILLRRPLLARELRGLLIDNLSIVEAAVEGRPATPSSKTIRAINSLLAKLRAEGGVRLRSALAELNRDLNDRKRLEALGVRAGQPRRGRRGD